MFSIYTYCHVLFYVILWCIIVVFLSLYVLFCTWMCWLGLLGVILRCFNVIFCIDICSFILLYIIFVMRCIILFCYVLLCFCLLYIVLFHIDMHCLYWFMSFCNMFLYSFLLYCSISFCSELHYIVLCLCCIAFHVLYQCVLLCIICIVLFYFHSFL